MIKKLSLLLLLFGSIALLTAQSTPSQLRVVTDANNYLLVAGATQTSPVSQPTQFINARLRTDASNNLLVVLTGGSFTSQFLGPVGNCTTAPAYSFTGDANTGMSSPSANTLCFVTDGTTRLTLNTTSLTSTLPILVPDGSNSAPSLAFSGDSDTGFWREGSGGLVFVNNATNSIELRTNDFRLGSGAQVSWASGDPTVTAADTILVRGAADRLDLVSGDSFNIVSGSATINNLNLITTSTIGLNVQNTTASTVGVPVQISPRVQIGGTAWDLNDNVSRSSRFFFEVLPESANTVTGTLKLGWLVAVDSTITYPLTIASDGSFNSNGSGVFATVSAANSGYINWTARSGLRSPANGQLNITNDGQTAGVGFDFATDAILKIRTRAQSAYATIDALAYQVSGVAGASGTCASVTVVNGIVTVCTP